MIHRFYEDPTMVAYGEENRDWGGAFGVYRGLTEALPYHRLFNSSHLRRPPLSVRRSAMRCGRPCGGRIDVLRFHGPRRRRNLQPDGQMAGDVGRCAEDADGAAGIGGGQIRRPALAGLDLDCGPCSRPEGDVPGHRLRCQRYAESGPARHRPGGLL